MSKEFYDVLNDQPTKFNLIREYDDLEDLLKANKYSFKRYLNGEGFDVNFLEDLIEHYKDIIPYGVQKGIDGDCEEWLVDYLDSRLYDLNISTKIFNE